jgi:iron complex transport system ATP-binding protein
MTLATQALKLVLGGRSVLDDISISLEKGRITAILGPNGAGKTSLIRVLAGLVAPDGGTVTLDGHPLHAVGLAERAKRIGYLPQNGVPAWNVTANELVGLGRLPHRSRFAAPTAQDRIAIEAALMATDTSGLAQRTMDAMSGGERARVKFARVLAGDPEWILADEPLANLDPPHQRDLLGLLRAAAENGKGVAVILHGLNAAARVADDTILLRDGRIVAHGRTRIVLTRGNLETTYRMAFDITEHANGMTILPAS